ncbi:ABC transporter permease subunit [Candidatus Bipolaricaulota bacterium]|nr:ABC transporter permease subunit [Candidatus Bipolaricaulota bacterium]
MAIANWYEWLTSILKTKIPLDTGVEVAIDFLTSVLAVPLDVFSKVLLTISRNLDQIFLNIPPLLFIGLVAALMGYVRNWKYSVFSLLALLLMFNLGLWEATLMTLSLVLTAALLSVVVGIPVGILTAHSQLAETIVRPILDFMQTIPPFVYLIPAMMFFGLGKVPAIAATFIYATPPSIRLTRLGFEEIPDEILEAGKAFGASPWQLLWKVEIPTAFSSIMMGINQTIMLSLSMMVIAAMIGAKGLGQQVLRSLSWIDVGMGFEAGIGIVVLAMVMDRMVTG